MNYPVVFDYPEGSSISNYLYYDLSPFELNENLFAIRLPNGVLISSGWYPDENGSGEFLTTAESGKGAIQPIASKSISDVQHDVQGLIDRFRQPIVSMSASASLPPLMYQAN